MTKAELRAWLRRIRQDVRGLEALLAQPGPITDVTWSEMEPLIRDASGAAEQIITEYEGDSE